VLATVDERNPKKGGRMAHFKCLACKARVWRDGDPADHLRDLCPGCGGPLDPVARAEEIVGFRALRKRRSAGHSIAEDVREAIARNDAARIRRLRSKNRRDLRT
jgi:NAD-dependent SIR2 family protein deacetylase